MDRRTSGSLFKSKGDLKVEWRCLVKNSIRMWEIGYFLGNLFALFYTVKTWGQFGGVMGAILLVVNGRAALIDLVRFARQVIETDELLDGQQQVDVQLGRVYSPWAACMMVLNIVMGVAVLVAGPLLWAYDKNLWVLWSKSTEEGVQVLFLILPSSVPFFAGITHYMAEVVISALLLPRRYEPLYKALECGRAGLLDDNAKAYDALMGEDELEDSVEEETKELHRRSPSISCKK